LKIGLIGAGLMAGGVARCLAGKGFEVVVYNRTRSRAEALAEAVKGSVAESPRAVLEDAGVAVVFIADDEALYDITLGSGGLLEAGSGLVVNSSTVTPMASSRVGVLLEKRGVSYAEAPVMGSVDEASQCRLLAMIGCSSELFDRVAGVVGSYAGRVVYAGEVPKAMVLKLAVNNLALAAPALIAESLALLEAWGVDSSLLREVAGQLWLKDVVERYWQRIVEEKPPRFKLWMAGKDYWYIASALKAKKLPAKLAEALSSLYMEAAQHGYMDKDYPQVAKYYAELARKARGKS